MLNLMERNCEGSITFSVEISATFKSASHSYQYAKITIKGQYFNEQNVLISTSTIKILIFFFFFFFFKKKNV